MSLAPSSLAPAVIDDHLSTVPAGPVRTCIATGEELAPERLVVEQAMAKNLFARAARRAVKVPEDLAVRIEWLLLERVLEDLSRARRAGRAVSGFVRVEQMIGRNGAGLLLVAEGADGDGLAKLRATGLPLERLADGQTLGGVFGREQAIYVAVARDDASGRFIQRIAGGAARWRAYRLNGAG